jgi:hypothetical protein
VCFTSAFNRTGDLLFFIRPKVMNTDRADFQIAYVGHLCFNGIGVVDYRSDFWK